MKERPGVSGSITATGWAEGCAELLALEENWQQCLPALWPVGRGSTISGDVFCACSVHVCHMLPASSEAAAPNSRAPYSPGSQGTHGAKGRLSPAARSVTSLLTLLSTAVRVSPADCSVSSPMRLRLWKVSKCSGP